MIGRKKELEILENIIAKNKSQLIAIHGRRRIGKTYLVSHLFEKYEGEYSFFKFTGSYSQDSISQIDYFLEAIYRWLGREDIPSQPITKWHEAFIYFNKRIKEHNIKNKFIMFIDEVPWVDRHNKSGFLSAFGHFYNSYIEENDNLIVILCGSNASWIKNKILKDTQGPLYHRVDKEIAMYPFDLQETKEYLLEEMDFDFDSQSIVDIYMVLGGVAKYLSYMDSSLSVPDNINNIFFHINAPLYNEYENIFKSLFADKSSSHQKIVTLLASKKSGYPILELEEKTRIKRTSLQKHIDELVDTGFIRSMSKINNEAKNTKYIIIDSLSLFHIKWVQSLSKNAISNANEYYQKLSRSQKYKIWQGFAFEVVCISNIDLYLQNRGFKASFLSAGYWSYIANKDIENDKGAQIDVLIKYDNNVYEIIECKYYQDVFVISGDYAEKLKHKKNKLREVLNNNRFDLKITIMSMKGTDINTYYNSIPISNDFNFKSLLEGKKTK